VASAVSTDKPIAKRNVSLGGNSAPEGELNGRPHFQCLQVFFFDEAFLLKLEITVSPCCIPDLPIECFDYVIDMVCLNHN
jgi:hypothetical protein